MFYGGGGGNGGGADGMVEGNVRANVVHTAERGRGRGRDRERERERTISNVYISISIKETSRDEEVRQRHTPLEWMPPYLSLGLWLRLGLTLT